MLLLALVAGSVPVHAQDSALNPVDMAIDMQGAPQFIAGGSYDILVRVSALGVSPDSPLSAMGVLITPPPGWVYLGAQDTGFGTPDIEPRSGSDVLEFAWINPPLSFPYEFAFTMGVPAEDGGVRYISGQGLYRTTGPEQLTAPVIVQTEGPDNQPPTIELIGDNPLDWPLGEPFVDPGYVATDAADGDVTSSVQVTGVVNHASEGTYTLNYTATDKVGNRSAPVSRQVNVVDFGDNPPPTSNPDDDDDSVSGGVGGGNFVNRGRGRNRVRNAQDDNDGKNRPRSGRNANNVRNQRNNRPDPANSNLARRLARNAARNNPATPNRPTQIVIPKSGTGSALANAAKEALAGREPGEADSGEAMDLAKAETAPGPRATPRRYADYEGEEGELEMAMAATRPTPVDGLNDAPQPGILAQMSTAIGNMGTREYVTLGGILAVLAVAGVLGAMGWRSVYRRTPRRRPGINGDTGSAE